MIMDNGMKWEGNERNPSWAILRYCQTFTCRNSGKSLSASLEK